VFDHWDQVARKNRESISATVRYILWAAKFGVEEIDLLEERELALNLAKESQIVTEHALKLANEGQEHCHKLAQVIDCIVEKVLAVTSEPAVILALSQMPDEIQRIFSSS
jgi:hypothetical protein